MSYIKQQCQTSNNNVRHQTKTSDIKQTKLPKNEGRNKNSLRSFRALVTRGKGRSIVKSNIIKRSVVVGGHKTSVSLENEFWNVLRESAYDRNCTVSELVASIAAGRQHGNLSSAIRLFVLDLYRTQFVSLSYPHERTGSLTLADLVDGKS